MLNVRQMASLLDRESHHLLIRRILNNGREISRACAALLQQPAVMPVAAAGLCLQRVCELSYGIEPLAVRLEHMLRGWQRADGLVVGKPVESHVLQQSERELPLGGLAATSIALRGWLMLHQQRNQCSSTSPSLATPPGTCNAIVRAWESLASKSACHDIERHIIHWQLGDEQLKGLAAECAIRASGREAGRRFATAA
ncbi:MAG: hypothetical protein ACR2GY_01060 [Phycisphaerales bacterium]